VLRIRDDYFPDPGSEFFQLRIPDQESKRSRIRINESKYGIFNSKNCFFLSSRKYDPECSMLIRIFFPSRIRNTDSSARKDTFRTASWLSTGKKHYLFTFSTIIPTSSADSLLTHSSRLSPTSRKPAMQEYIPGGYLNYRTS
jgi:hypothetical protein